MRQKLSQWEQIQSPMMRKSIVWSRSITSLIFLVWSFGMILYEMISLQMPFQEIELFDVRNHVLQGNLPKMDIISSTYHPVKNLLLECIKFDPLERPNATDCMLSLLKIS